MHVRCHWLWRADTPLAGRQLSEITHDMDFKFREKSAKCALNHLARLRNREVTSRERDEPMINGSSFIRSSLQQIFVPSWLKTRDLGSELL